MRNNSYNKSLTPNTNIEDVAIDESMKGLGELKFKLARLEDNNIFLKNLIK